MLASANQNRFRFTAIEGEAITFWHLMYSDRMMCTVFLFKSILLRH